MTRYLLIILLIVNIKAYSQQIADTISLSDKFILYGIIRNGDTLLMSTIKEVIILPTPKFTSPYQWRRYQRLVRNVKKVYPYAKLAGQKYDIVTAHLSTLKTEKEQKAYIKQVEAEIKDEFEEDLKSLTITQGRILLKLIDREIGETSYDLVKDFKGSFSAMFWQTLARIFGHNLKSEFDPKGEDRLLNDIVLLIENGQI